jgi:hypothetical protein
VCVCLFKVRQFVCCVHLNKIQIKMSITEPGIKLNNIINAWQNEKGRDQRRERRGLEVQNQRRKNDILTSDSNLSAVDMVSLNYMP